MQVWTYDGGSTFVMDRVAGWRYLPGTGPLGTTLYQPPGGKLPAWALRLAAGESYNLPAASPRSATVIITPPASSAAGTATVTNPSRLTAAAAVIAALAAVLTIITLIRLTARRRGRPATRPRRNPSR
jgi:hypothetical protein